MKHRQLLDVLDWVGRPESADLMSRLEAFEQWLLREGVAGGGLGPAETDVWVRHVLDSLMFARGLEVDPDTILDLGSGVGLPGIPLALLFPSANIILLDRSGRRMEMARRAARVVRAENIRTVRSDFAAFEGEFPAVVMRAALQPASAVEALRRHISPAGRGVLGVGLDRSPGLPGELEQFPGSQVLDAGRWLLIMRG